MVFFPTEEMKELEKKFRSYMDGATIKENAPKEAVVAFKKYHQLTKQQHDDEVKSWFE